MISYSYRRGTDKVVLLYPNATGTLSDDFIFRIEHGKNNDEIKIKVVDVPFWSGKDITSIESELFTKLNNVLTSGF
jgi:5-methylcytosine-specific restriction enzyme subunit McrC